MLGCLSPVVKEKAAVLVPKDLRPVLAAGLGLVVIKITKIDMLWPTSYGASLHLLVKMFGIHIAFLLFYVGWNVGVRRQTLRGLALSAASLSMGLLNMFHLLSLPMMPPLITPNSFNKATLFSALSSVLLPLLMLIISLLPVRRISSSMQRLSLGTSLLFTGICTIAVLFYEQNLPRFFIGEEPVRKAGVYVGLASCCFSLLLALRYAEIYSKSYKDVHRKMVILAVMWALSQASFFFLTCRWQFSCLVSHVYRLLVLWYIYHSVAIPFGKRPHYSLDRAQEQLRRTRGLRTLGRLVGHLAHELKNPLAAIRASAQLSAILDDRQERQRVTERIEAEVDRLSELIAITLEVGWDRPEMWDSVNVEEMVDELISLWDVELERLGIESKVYAELTIPPIQGNAKLLHRALTNLVTNAVDAMPNGGEFAIRLVYEDDLHCVRIEISDTGSGIPEEIRGRVFQEMVTTKPRGTGLGLMITYQIICELHRGELWFETIPGQGTTFFIRLPIKRGRLLSAKTESTAFALWQNTDDYPWD